MQNQMVAHKESGGISPWLSGAIVVVVIGVIGFVVSRWVHNTDPFNEFLVYNSPRHEPGAVTAKNILFQHIYDQRP